MGTQGPSANHVAYWYFTSFTPECVLRDWLRLRDITDEPRWSLVAGRF
jgi:hypothetical protein